MKSFKILATSYIFFSSCNVEFIQSFLREFLAINCGFEIKGDIIHEETLEFFLEPLNGFFGLHIDI